MTGSRRPKLDWPLESVETWVFSTDAHTAPAQAFERLLDREEQERATRFHFPASRDSFVQTRGVLRVLLGRYLELEPATIEFAYGKNGKPRLASPFPLHFSVSHSRNLSVVSFAANTEIGVDVEAVEGFADWEEVAERFFGRQETDEIRSLPVADRATAFFRCWTRKEACVKATGDGISAAGDSFRVSVRGDQPPTVASLSPGDVAPGWNLHDVEVDPGFVAALAYPGVRRECRVHRIRDLDLLASRLSGLQPEQI